MASGLGKELDQRNKAVPPLVLRAPQFHGVARVESPTVSKFRPLVSAHLLSSFPTHIFTPADTVAPSHETKGTQALASGDMDLGTWLSACLLLRCQVGC